MSTYIISRHFILICINLKVLYFGRLATLLSAFSRISLCYNTPMNMPLYEGAMMFPMGTPLICHH